MKIFTKQAWNSNHKWRSDFNQGQVETIVGVMVPLFGKGATHAN